ncbi:flagellar basal body rod protein FlgB [uncultured Oscillibacter sp.]|uniref:flagellar basal body rod protein FlgB n=1 Tax=uncultured Oscillibacter sp. TaxID=876091 RepID=UPI00280B6101|nr:flagellar basal body rod protein FlgB [uncultured Oscillibacter sp.]
MECLNSNSLRMLQRSMGYLWSKQACILDNVANAETPGYKTKYATFEESLQKAIQSASRDGTDAFSIREAIETTPVEIRQAEESTRLDGNGVNVTEQMVELVREGYQMQYVMNAISSDFSMIRTAIIG